MNQAEALTSGTETTVMTVWPSNGAFVCGKVLGRLYDISAGFYIFTVGNVIALATAPIAAVLYIIRLLPFIGRRYCITNQRVVVQTGVVGRGEEKSISLDGFADVEIEVEPGQAWYRSGNLVFRDDKGTETFRLEGVSRPEAFRAAIMKSRQSFVSINEALQRQPAIA